MGTLGLYFGLPIDFFKGILKINLEVLWGHIGSIMNVTLGYFRVIFVVLWGIDESTLRLLSGYFRVTLGVIGVNLGIPQDPREDKVKMPIFDRF